MLTDCAAQECSGSLLERFIPAIYGCHIVAKGKI